MSEHTDHIFPYSADLKEEKPCAVAMTFYLINCSIYVITQQEMLNMWNISMRKKKKLPLVVSCIMPFSSFILNEE